jgi:hypothetical protein
MNQPRGARHQFRGVVHKGVFRSTPKLLNLRGRLRRGLVVN